VGKSQVAAAPWPLGQPRGKDCQPRRRACIADDDQLMQSLLTLHEEQSQRSAKAANAD